MAVNSVSILATGVQQLTTTRKMVTTLQRLLNPQMMVIRQFATAANKERMWKRRGMAKSSSRLDQTHSRQEETTVTPEAEEGTNWRPLVFLVVFPMVMSTVVVTSREDLLQDLQARRDGFVAKDIRDVKLKECAEENDRERGPR
eukprot:scaffold6299_cov107-Cylindrotheca_fusiformis.AAC.10